MKNNDWLPITRDTREGGDDRIIGAYSVQDDEIHSSQSESTSVRMDRLTAEGVPGLSRDRLEEIRHRLEDGTYVSEAMAEQVARKLIARGDF